MKLHTLSTEIFLPITIARGWEFFSNPANLALITPPELGLEVTSELPERVYPGMIVTYRVRPLFNIPLRWVTEITHVREPYLFVDEQRSGPYRFWHHKHFLREADGGIIVEDLVHYALPFGPLGNFMQPLVVRGQLDRIFDFREAYLKEHFGSGRKVEPAVRRA